MSRLAWILAVACIFVAASALAQAPVDPGLDLLRERQRNESLRSLGNAPVGSRLELESRDAKPSAVCFPVVRIDVDGVESLLEGSLHEATSAFADRCLGQSEIEQLIHAVRKTYIERGYITTQVVVPAQDLKSGILRLTVVEGRVSRLVYGVLREDKAPEIAPWGKRITAFPGVSGRVLNLRDLEQGLAQINRIPSSAASVDILPGEEPGTSIVRVIERRQRAVRASMGFDSHGQAATGRTRARANLELDNILTLNDSWSASYAGSRSSNALATTVSLPYGYWTFHNAASYSQQSAALSQVADMVTESVTNAAALDRVIYRDANHVVRVSQSFAWYWSRRFINATALQEQFIAWSRSGLAVERYFQQSRISMEAGASFGLPEFARAGASSAQVAQSLTSRFRKIDISATYITHLGSGWSFVANVTGQYSGDSLYAANQITAGGWDSVRGIQGASISGDTGAFFRTELQWGAALPWARQPGDPQLGKPPSAVWRDLSLVGVGRQMVTSVSPYAFMDGGVIRGNASKGEDKLLTLGAGVRTGGERVSFDVAVGTPLIAPSGRSRGVAASMSLNVKLW